MKNTLILGATLAGMISSATAASIIVDAAAGADLVVDFASGTVGTHDSQAVPPSASANIYASLDGGATLLNSGNTNASLAWTQTITNGLVIDLILEDFGGETASVFGFDIRNTADSAFLYDGAVDGGNGNTGAAAFSVGASQNWTDSNGDTITMTFTELADLGDVVSNTNSTAGGTGDGSDSRYQLTFAVTPVPEPSSTALLGLGGLALILRRRK